MLGAISVAAMIFAARSILLLAVIGAVGLTWLALQTADVMHLGAVAIYTVTVVLPLVALASRS